MKTEVDINTDILSWAIERAGYDVREFEVKFPKVSEWLEKQKKPTVRQLEDFARKVHLPFGYLLLDEPPEEEVPIPFFRTYQTRTDKVSLNVYDTILLYQKRQQWLQQYFRDNDFDKPDFVGRFKGETDFRTIVKDIRAELNLNTEWAGNQPNWEKALDHLTQLVENKGIIVAFNGVVGNNTKRPIPVEECRGFVLVDDTAPFMFVNSRDSKAAQMFTIAHELGHIWTGKSAGFDFRQMQPAGDANEKLCDKIAAELLVPEDIFIQKWAATNDFKTLARHFKVSPIVVARRALDTGKISKTAFFSFYNNYLEDVRDKKNRQESGGDFYKTAKKRLSRRFLTHVDRAVRENYLLVRDAYHLTGLKGSTFRELMSNQLYS